jgi:type IV pilus assembly protein PilY1
MGRGLYMVNARTGDIIWQASGHARVGSSTHPYKVVSGMDYSIPSDVAVVVGDPTTHPFRAYVGDTGGQMWRLDFGDADPANWTVWKVASIADQTTTAGRRKFMFPPEVVGATSFDAVISGTGDRDHPFDTTVTNRVYMFKDKVRTGAPFSGSPLAQVQATITEGTGAGAPMLDVTSNCIQDASGCTGVTPQVAGGGYTASQNTANALTASTNFGWYLTLASGEKQVGGTVATGAVGSLGGAITFATNQPSTVTGTAAVCQQVPTGACQANLGNACTYTLNFLDGTAIVDLNSSNTVTTADRAVAYAGGGFLPSPVLVYVALGGTTGTGGSSTSSGVPVGGTIVGDQLKVGAPPAMGGGNDPTGVVCFGASCSQAPGVQLYSRLRKFWFKELD